MRSRWSVGFVFSMLCLVTALYSVKQVPDARVIYSADFSLSNHWYRFEIEKTGIYNLTYSDLSSLPLADMDPRNIRIFTNGGALLNINSSETGNPFLEIPLYIQGESDGTFHEEDRIIFYAENRDSPNKNSSVSQTNNPYSGTCSYWLNFDGDYGYPPRRMEFLQAVSGEAITTTEYLHSVHFEQENIRKTIDNFKWFSTKIHQGGNEAFSTDINIIDPVSSGAIQGIIELSLEQSGDTSGIVNTINVENNGVSAFLQNWSAIQGYYISKSDFPLYSAVNNIKLELLSSNPVFLDYINLKYQRRFIKHQNESYFIDIQQSDAGLNRCFRFETDSEEELLVFQADNYSEAYLVPFVRESNGLSFTTDCKQVNASYNIEPDYYIVSIENLLRVNQLSAYSPGELSEIQPETDCFIITPDDFLSQSQTLAHLYSEFKGINSLIIRLNDVFDTYNGGNPDPGAVRLYLKNSLRQLSKPESLQVILIGSGTNDWRGFDQKSIPLNKMIVYQRGFIT
ncbi:MAG: hypothetical protein JXR56_03550, partial [Candidatus Cloacimonetes bacterium]|nr:hypothetical protein [Candidatus Cloacimonadota bacterium]